LFGSYLKLFEPFYFIYIQYVQIMINTAIFLRITINANNALDFHIISVLFLAIAFYHLIYQLQDFIV
ncbi:hypothetical protein, partial [uncultured Duncaniella sp.]|uniref:hypothetical protein n=1 Tax=uncultured Duncaniella sp. TaxID=2768039 RepID=UPI0025A5CE15